MPTGRVTAGSTVRVLDHRGWPAPVGLPGCCGSAIDGEVDRRRETQGYLNRPALTAEHFRPDLCGGRRYRTGELGHWLPDGNLDFLGRIDRQVKICGMRIELGEIEAVLRALPGIRKALVVTGDEGGVANPYSRPRCCGPWAGAGGFERRPDPQAPARC